MFCKGCGKEIPDGSQFCPSCGINLSRRVAPSVMPEVTAVKKTSSGKKILKAALICVAVVVVLFVGLTVIGWLMEPDYIQMIKDSTLNKYDYGKPIGVALNDWFEGDVTWDSYEQYDTVYVTATGNCPYLTSGYDSYQRFVFHVVDDDHFGFDGAYDSDDNEIFTQSNSAISDLYVELLSSLGGVDLHESGLMAAFGDEKSLKIFKNEEDNEDEEYDEDEDYDYY